MRSRRILSHSVASLLLFSFFSLSFLSSLLISSSRSSFVCRGSSEKPETCLESIGWLIQETNTIKNWFAAHYWPMWIINQGLPAITERTCAWECVLGISPHIHILSVLLCSRRWPAVKWGVMARTCKSKHGQGPQSFTVNWLFAGISERGLFVCSPVLNSGF